MTVFELWLGTILFGLTLWLGLYLLGREPRKSLSWFAGSTSISVAISIYFAIANHYAFTIRMAQSFIRYRQLFYVVAVFTWFLFLLRLVPGEKSFQERIQHNQPAMIVILLTSVLVAFSTVGILFPFGVTLYTGLLLGGAFFFAGGTAAADIISREQSEALWPDYWRSLDYALCMSLIFGGQVALVMRFATGVSFVMLNLLFGTVLTAVVIQAFSRQFAELVDRIAFATFPAIRKERAQFRATSEAAARQDETATPLMLSGDEFAKLTRRAIGEMGNLPRLAANPLTQLPLIRHRLTENGQDINTLSQANELKQLLRSCIEQLKPIGGEPFSPTDEWRHFNALYYPYVVGLRPYRRYFSKSDLSNGEQQALAYFQQNVPPRTLYNWQQAAARLISQDIREQSRKLSRQLQQQTQMM